MEASAEDLRAEAERAGAAVYLKDALAVLLEVRPTDPIAFLSAYFRHAAARPDDPEADLPSLAWYLIRACSRRRPCFRDNLYAAFSALQLRARGREGAADSAAGGGGPGAAGFGERYARVRAAEGVAGQDLLVLLQLLCQGLPAEVAEDLLSELRPAAARPVRFPEFSMTVEACLAAEEAQRGAGRLFAACGACGACGRSRSRGGEPRLPREELLAEIEHWRRRQPPEGPGQPQPADARFPLAPLGPEAFDGGEADAAAAEVPPAEALRERLAEMGLASPGVLVGPGDLFRAMWRCSRAEDADGSASAAA